jgi:hypothetical protein
LEFFGTGTLALAAGVTQLALPAGYEAGDVLGVFRDDGDGRLTRLLRWRETDDQLRVWNEVQPAVPVLNPPPASLTTPLTWDTPALKFITFYPAQQEDLDIILRLRFKPSAVDDEVPEWLLYGALARLGRSLIQDARAEAWEAEFQRDLESAVAQAITASSVPIRLGG